MLLLDATFSKIRKISGNIRNSHHCENGEKLRTVCTLVDVLKAITDRSTSELLFCMLRSKHSYTNAR